MGSKPSGFVILAASGCFLGLLLTLLIWFFAVMVMYGVAGGDCSPEFGSCPTDHERNVRIAVVALAALSLNVLGFLAIGRVLARNLNAKD